MSSIYENATLCLSVEDAEGCQKGFFGMKPGPERLARNGDSITLALVRDNSTPGRNFPPILETRGWTLQERVLSPAVLRLKPEEMFWECCSHFASQREPRMRLLGAALSPEPHLVAPSASRSEATDL